MTMPDNLHLWAPAIFGAALGIGAFTFAWISTRRLDARIRKRRELQAKAAEGDTPAR